MGNGSSSQKNKNKYQSKKSKSTSKSRSPRQSPRHTPGHSPEHYRRRKSGENQSGEGGQLVPQIGGTDRKASTGSTSATHQATHGLVLADSHRTNSMEPKDVMISYSHQDKDFMRKIKCKLLSFYY